MSTAALVVPGATLSYTVSGSGPLLLCISGSSGTGAVWRWVSHILSSSFTVVIYSRRGFKDSILHSPQDYTPDVRLARDADDAFELLKHLSPTSPAYVIGNSSGAIVALELLRRHPDSVRYMICHEPPLTKSLPAEEGQQLHKFYSDVYGTCRDHGLPAAIEMFTANFGRNIDADLVRQAMSDPANRNNVEYWMEHELRQYTAIEPNYEALRDHNGKLFMVSGKESAATPLRATTEAVARRVGAQARTIPGGHVPMASTPQEFAEAVVKIFLPTPPHMWPMFVP